MSALSSLRNSNSSFPSFETPILKNRKTNEQISISLLFIPEIAENNEKIKNVLW
jgi:hypothetical protein